MKAILFGLILIAAVGCTQFQPVGPFAKYMGGGPSKPPTGKAKNEPPDVVTVQAPRPTPPAMLIVEGDVTTENAYDATKKLKFEIDTDYKTMPTSTGTAEISVVGGSK